ncbi:MAG: penicillin acylase family protein [Myxococcales bacterium]|nr:penicillin acylase family protein [Myxococcales bacterium]MDH5306856.1 penicillin acylase family protein [Myxococcales bacterium]MDH5567535.1 penicillin acylase family protein [Myxococcales bacterium]
MESIPGASDSRRPLRTLAALALASSLALGSASVASGADGIEIPGLTQRVDLILDREGVPHIFARNDFDLARVQGFVHARDRFFQMDATRRQVSGDLAELLGPSLIGSDVQNRTIGLRRAAERSLGALSAREVALLEAYADGVNSYLARYPLPVEYALLELTQARPWRPVDCLVIGKAIAASLSLDIDIPQTLQLDEYVQAGFPGGFDGQALFFEDVRRSAPIDPAATIPDATGGTPFVARAFDVDPIRLARAAAAARELQARLAEVPFLSRAMQRRELSIGSNEWAVSGRHTSSGRPLLANDPHLSLDTPSTFYEWHLVVEDDPESGPMNVSGVGFPGTPSVILGQNERITWGATTNPMDVSDIFADTFIVDPAGACAPVGTPACIVSAGAVHPVVIEPASYFTNQPDNGVPDDVVPAPVPPQQRQIATVPFRSFGPVLSLDDPSVLETGGATTALVLQFTGFHATRELSSFAAWNRARNLDEFLAALADFDFGSQNWAYADADGNIAYFTSAELPLRRDLEQSTVAGLPPFFIRDGSGAANWLPDPARSQGQAIPYAVLPFEEMPQTVNPPNGFFVNANNDPAGVSLDNDPLNQVRPSNPAAIYYLNPSFADGLRAGRITRLVREHIEAGKKIGYKDMQDFQANTQQLDAELMTPFLLTAQRNALRPGAPAELAALAQDAGVAEAVARIAAWDFSTPTGIPEGYDAKDTNGNRTLDVPEKEALASVAATLYNMWRGALIRATVDATLARIGVSGVSAGDALKAVHHLLSQQPFTGVGASGVDFFAEPAALGTPEDRRDAALLAALRAALDALASPTFGAAFGGSQDQNDYRWGRLHRITFDHPFAPPFSIPPAAGFENLSPQLSGLARDGGYEVVNASGFSARANSLNGFKFGGGPVRRYVGEGGVNWGPVGSVRGVNVIPGGPSGDPSSPQYATQLGNWLTADNHPVRMTRVPNQADAIAVEVFVPAAP